MHTQPNPKPNSNTPPHRAGLARLTVQGRFEADACQKIREALWEKGIDIPLVHHRPN